MRGLVRFLGTVLVAVGLGGFVLVQVAPALTSRQAPNAPLGVVVELGRALRLTAPPDAPVSPASSAVQSAIESDARPITRLRIPSLDLDTAVVPAALVEHDGASTWEVPSFVAGHAEGTAGAGERGNAVIIGHVTSITLGNVFEHLNDVHSGDRVQVFSGDRRFDYLITDARDVQRTDISVLAQTDAPTVTLITCSGLWLPIVWDYAQRLVVQGSLVES